MKEATCIAHLTGHSQLPRAVMSGGHRKKFAAIKHNANTLTDAIPAQDVVVSESTLAEHHVTAEGSPQKHDLPQPHCSAVSRMIQGPVFCLQQLELVMGLSDPV